MTNTNRASKLRLTQLSPVSTDQHTCGQPPASLAAHKAQAEPPASACCAYNGATPKSAPPGAWPRPRVVQERSQAGQCGAVRGRFQKRTLRTTLCAVSGAGRACADGHALLLAVVAIGHKAEGAFLRWEVCGLLRVGQRVGGVQDAGPGGVGGVHTALDPAVLRQRGVDGRGWGVE